MSDAPAKLMTADELFELPDDGMRHELIDGELTTMAPAGGEHGSVIVNLTLLIGNYVKANKLGRVFSENTGFIVKRNADTVLAPDVSFVDAKRLPGSSVTSRFVPLTPDLAVEVVSPSDKFEDVADKAKRFISSGARLVWIVSPKARTVTVHAPSRKPLIVSEDETLEGGEVLPGFNVAVAEIFA